MEGATLIDNFAVSDSSQPVLNPYSFMFGLPLGLLINRWNSAVGF